MADNAVLGGNMSKVICDICGMSFVENFSGVVVKDTCNYCDDCYRKNTYGGEWLTDGCQ